MCAFVCVCVCLKLKSATTTYIVFVCSVKGVVVVVVKQWEKGDGVELVTSTVVCEESECEHNA